MRNCGLNTDRASGRCRAEGLAVCLVLGAGLGCVTGPGAESASHPNVIIVSLDTVRWDHTTLSDETLQTTPNLAQLAAMPGATVFTQAITPGSWSLPAYASLFTGQGVMDHGVGFTRTAISEQTATLPEVFSAYGYRTAGFATGPHVTEPSGFGRGFDHFAPAMHSVHLTGQVNDALAWLDADDSSPFLLFIHGYDAHLPYAAPAVFSALFDVSPKLHRSARSCAALVDDGPWTCRGDGVDAQTLSEQPEMTAHMNAHYDTAVRHADYQLGRLLHALSERGHLDDAIIVAMSDHGESLELPDPFQHDWGCGEPVFRVPLVIVRPEDSAPVQVDEPVSLADVLPSLAGELGMAAPSGVTGQPLFATDSAVTSTASPRIVTAASKRCYWARSEGWTLQGALPSTPSDEIAWTLQQGQSADDVAAAHPDAFERMHATLAEWPTHLDLVELNRRPGRTNKAIEKALREGGYWSPPGQEP